MSSFMALRPPTILSSSTSSFTSSLSVFSPPLGSVSVLSFSASISRTFPIIPPSPSLGYCINKREDAIGADTSVSELEAEIHDYIEKSKKPETFPTRKELILAGRTDLAEAIAKEGGWLTYGWDLERGEGGEDEEVSRTRPKDRSLEDSFSCSSM